jgi:hypothetical protein
MEMIGLQNELRVAVLCMQPCRRVVSQPLNLKPNSGNDPWNQQLARPLPQLSLFRKSEQSTGADTHQNPWFGAVSIPSD